MNPRRARLTSSACVQMIACGPSGITTCRAPRSSPGRRFPVACGGVIRSWPPCTTSTGTVIRARSARKSSSNAAAQPDTAAADALMTTWKLLLLYLIADPDPAGQVKVVRPVQERLGRGRPVGTDLAHELADDAAVNPAGVVSSAWQAGRQRCQQHGRTHPSVAIGSQIAGHL